ncbi:MAG: hypothetical protein Q9190_007244 [Brigantiaea leucoxantha]
MGQMDLSSTIHVSIEPVASSYHVEEPITLHVVLQNRASHPITVLTWDSPLDPRAGVLGIFQARDAQYDTVVRGDVIKFARQLPPNRDSFVEVGSHQQTETWVKLPVMQLKSGRGYLVEARGKWKAVWNRKLDEIEKSSLDSMTGASTGSFNYFSARMDVD